MSTPYAMANLPLLAKQGWDDGNGEFRIGSDVLTEKLQLRAAPKGAYAPGLSLTTDSLRYLAATGGEYTVLPGSLRSYVQSQPNIAGSLTFRLRDMSGERITALFANDDASSALNGDRPSPAAFFASLANAYAPAGTNRLAIVASPLPTVSEELRQQIYGVISRESWIRTLTLAEAKQKYHPSTQPATLLNYLDPVSGYITETYYQKLEAAHELFEDYRAAVDHDEAPMVALTRKMYTAESGYFTSSNVKPEDANRGLLYLNDVTSFIKGEFEKISIGVSTPLLQGSADGEADITINNGNSYPFTADIVMEGSGVEFPQGASQHMKLPPGITKLKINKNGSGW
jgi:hypothetical protein